jgi:hypothetical protein
MIDHIDWRARYFDDKERAVDTHRQQSFEYEKQAIEYSNSVFKVLTYLNGGALVAIPAVVTLLKSDIASRHVSLLATAGVFVAGLIFVVLSQGFAFYTMARRSEAQESLAREQQVLLGMTYYPEQFDTEKARAEAKGYREEANVKIEVSNKVRFAALVFVWLSVSSFIVGCGFGAYAVLS